MAESVPDPAKIIEAVAAAAPAQPPEDRPRGVVYAKCVLKCTISGAWALGNAVIIWKFIRDPKTMITILNAVLPGGVILLKMSEGCVKLSLQADSLSSLKELWKRFTEGVLQKDISKVLLTPDLLQFAEAGQNVELEVQIDERIYKEACLDLMVDMVLQNSGNTSLSHRRSFSESNLVVNSSKINKEVFLQVKPQATQESRQPKITDVTPPALTPKQQVRNVYFLNIEVFEKVQVRQSGLPSQQRIKNGTVHMVAIHESADESTSQISDIKVWVYREPTAAKLYGDKQGRQNLPVLEMRKLSTSMTYFSVNLDDVYTGPEGRPFYELAKIDVKTKNVFQLSALLYFTNGTVSKEFFSEPFHISGTKIKQIRTDEPLSDVVTSFSSLSLSPDLPDDSIRVHTLVADQVVSSSVEYGTMTSGNIDKAMKETRTEKSFSCANFVRVDKVIAGQIEYKAITDTQNPRVTESASKDKPGYEKESMSRIIAKTIIVERLIVNHLFYDELNKSSN